MCLAVSSTVSIRFEVSTEVKKNNLRSDSLLAITWFDFDEKILHNSTILIIQPLRINITKFSGTETT